MKRSNIRFTKRIKVRGSVEERLLHMEKLNELLLKQYVVQDNINKGLLGRITGDTKKRNKMHDDVVVRFATVSDEIHTVRTKLIETNTTLDEMMLNMNTMEEVLEDLA